MPRTKKVPGKTTSKGKRKASASGAGKRLTAEQKAEIAAAGKTGATQAAIASQFGIGLPTVRKIIGRRSGKGAAATRERGRSTTAGNGRSKLTDTQRAEIAADTTSTLKQLAERFGVSVNTIVKNRKPGGGRRQGGGSARSVPTESLEGVTFVVAGGRINFSLDRSHPLAKKILADLTQ
jgi:transposase-like protein